MSIRKKIESKIGRITLQELEFAIDHIEKHLTQCNTRLFDDTCYDIMATAIDFYRRHKLAEVK